MCLKTQSITSTFAVRLVIGCGLLLRVMLFTCAQHECAKNLAKQRDSNAVRKSMPDKRIHEVY